MLTLTPEAVSADVDLVVGEAAGPAAGLRISPGPPSAADRTWNYAVVHEPLEGDAVVEAPRRIELAGFQGAIAVAIEHAAKAKAIEEFTDCTPGKRDRWSRKNASYALISRQTIRSKKSVSPISV